MRLFSREAWSYAVLLVILFTIATIAVIETLSYLEELVSTQQFRSVTAIIWSLTLGFMLIAGAFGLWAIQFSAAAESRRRVERLVNAMDYLTDGLLVVDARGRIGATNPVVSTMIGTDPDIGSPFSVLFPSLSDEEVGGLLDRETPYEVEYAHTADGATRTLRLRSQPSEDLMLILISDVTSMNAERSKARQAAKLELIAHLARGVAHDFNNLLCVISGHVSIVSNTRSCSPEAMASLSAIADGTERGIALASHLLSLVQPQIEGQAGAIVDEHIATAANMLRNSLSLGWQVHTDLTEQLPRVALTGTQMEQIILSLGHLVADATNGTGTLRITAAHPSSTDTLYDIGSGYAGLIIISSTEADLVGESDALIRDTEEQDAGLLQSVIASILEEGGGGLDVLTAADGSPLYRVKLPLAHIDVKPGEIAELPAELIAYISDWHLLIAQTKRRNDTDLLRRISDIGVGVEHVDDVTAALARIEDMPQLDAMVLDKALLGPEANGLLKAILKLRPSAGIAVRCESPDTEPAELAKAIVFFDIAATPDATLLHMIEAKSMAARRHS